MANSYYGSMHVDICTYMYVCMHAWVTAEPHLVWGYNVFSTWVDVLLMFILMHLLTDGFSSYQSISSTLRCCSCSRQICHSVGRCCKRFFCRLACACWFSGWLFGRYDDCSCFPFLANTLKSVRGIGWRRHYLH